MRTEEFNLDGFSRVNVGGACDVEVVQASSYNVTITADDSLFRYLNVSKDGEILKVGRSKHIGWRPRITRPMVRIAMPLFRGLQLSGATRGTVHGFSSSEDFELKLSGASSVTGEITAGDTELSLSGASSVTGKITAGDTELSLSGASRAELTGSANDVVIKASGASRVELGGFAVHNVAIKLSGASQSTVKLDGTLNARLSGASHLSWIGNPIIGDIRASGASRLSRK